MADHVRVLAPPVREGGSSTERSRDGVFHWGPVFDDVNHVRADSWDASVKPEDILRDIAIGIHEAHGGCDDPLCLMCARRRRDAKRLLR